MSAVAKRRASRGSHSPKLLAPLGLHVPVYPVKGYSITLPQVNAECAPAVSLTDEAEKLVFSRLGERLRVAAASAAAAESRERHDGRSADQADQDVPSADRADRLPRRSSRSAGITEAVPSFAAAGGEPRIVLVEDDAAAGPDRAGGDQLGGRQGVEVEHAELAVVDRTEQEPRERAVQLGAFDFISKPFKPNDLRRVILRATAELGLKLDYELPDAPPAAD